MLPEMHNLRIRFTKSLFYISILIRLFQFFKNETRIVCVQVRTLISSAMQNGSDDADWHFASPKSNYIRKTTSDFRHMATVPEI